MDTGVYILPDGTVIHVEHDELAESPLAWNDSTAVWAFRGGYASIWDAVPDNETLRIFADLYGRFGADIALRIVNRCSWLETVHLDVIEGYSQSDWQYLAYVGPVDIKSLESWAFGDVYVITVGNDSIGGIYDPTQDLIEEMFGIDISGIRPAVKVISYE